MSPRSDAVAEVFSALGDPQRRVVVELLAERGVATGTQLAAELPITRQAVAKHLAALGRAGLVESTRAGRETRYRLTPGPLSDALDWMVAVGAEWDERLAALRRTLTSAESSEVTRPG